ncbi:unnamed protein product [Soboliphyme baturini]|uniref:Vesicle transport protein n=1 Tax=Soboliphyme baturini TaxID=241478 RepID=A0A183IIK3_9BILA|nr:unnamed protein product [Soboliphyme baturini]
MPFCFQAGFYIPLLIVKARKFGALYSLGSFFMLLSFVILLGPRSFFGLLFSQDRSLLTCGYFLSLFGTLYCSVWVSRCFLKKQVIVPDFAFDELPLNRIFSICELQTMQVSVHTHFYNNVAGVIRFSCELYDV